MHFSSNEMSLRDVCKTAIKICFHICLLSTSMLHNPAGSPAVSDTSLVDSLTFWVLERILSEVCCALSARKKSLLVPLYCQSSLPIPYSHPSSCASETAGAGIEHVLPNQCTQPQAESQSKLIQNRPRYGLRAVALCFSMVHDSFWVRILPSRSVNSPAFCDVMVRKRAGLGFNLYWWRQGSG
jgi:hypothetical protein